MAKCFHLGFAILVLTVLLHLNLAFESRDSERTGWDSPQNEEYYFRKYGSMMGIDSAKRFHVNDKARAERQGRKAFRRFMNEKYDEDAETGFERERDLRNSGIQGLQGMRPFDGVNSRHISRGFGKASDHLKDMKKSTSDIKSRSFYNFPSDFGGEQANEGMSQNNWIRNEKTRFHDWKRNGQKDEMTFGAGTHVSVDGDMKHDVNRKSDFIDIELKRKLDALDKVQEEHNSRDEDDKFSYLKGLSQRKRDKKETELYERAADENIHGVIQKEHRLKDFKRSVNSLDESKIHNSKDAADVENILEDLEKKMSLQKVTRDPNQRKHVVVAAENTIKRDSVHTGAKGKEGLGKLDGISLDDIQGIIREGEARLRNLREENDMERRKKTLLSKEHTSAFKDIEAKRDDTDETEELENDVATKDFSRGATYGKFRDSKEIKGLAGMENRKKERNEIWKNGKRSKINHKTEKALLSLDQDGEDERNENAWLRLRHLLEEQHVGRKAEEQMRAVKTWCPQRLTLVPGLEASDKGRKEAERCCYAHYKCPLIKIMGGTALDCQCEEMFYACLKSADTAVANIVGSRYFNTFPRKCYKYRQVVTCHGEACRPSHVIKKTAISIF